MRNARVSPPGGTTSTKSGDWERSVAAASPGEEATVISAPTAASRSEMDSGTGPRGA